MIESNIKHNSSPKSKEFCLKLTLSHREEVLELESELLANTSMHIHMIFNVLKILLRNSDPLIVIPIHPVMNHKTLLENLGKHDFCHDTYRVLI